MDLNQVSPYWQFQVFNLVGDTDIANRWWRSPNKAFNMKTPLEVWETNPEKVKLYVVNYHCNDYY